MQLHMRCTATVGGKRGLNRLKRLAEYQRSWDVPIPGCVNSTAQLEYLPRISEKGGDSVGHLYYSYSTVQMQGVTGEYVGGCCFEKRRRCLDRRIHLRPLRSAAGIEQLSFTGASGHAMLTDARASPAGR